MAPETLIEDTEANRDTYTPTWGAHYHSTDTGRWYLGDGNGWLDISPTGGANVTGGAYDAGAFDGATGGAKIQAALDAAAAAGGGTVIVGRAGPDDVSANPSAGGDARATAAWLLPAALSVASNTALVFRGAYLFLADGTDQNLIRNAAATSGDATRNENIHIRGDRSTYLNGNGTGQTRPLAPSETQTEPGALEHFGILLYKVDNCSISGFQIGQTAGWGVVIQDFTDCVMRDLAFRQDAAVWNQDGCSFIGPGERGRIDGITGTFGDDLATAYCNTDWLSPTAGPGGDLSDITITNCTARAASNTTLTPGIRLQTGGATALSEVTISDVHLEGGHLKFANSNSPAAHAELQNIAVSNVTSVGAGGGVMMGGSMQNLSISGYQFRDSVDVFIYPNWDLGTTEPTRVRNLTIENCAVESDGKLYADGVHTELMENVTLRDIDYTTVSGGDGTGARILFYSTGTLRDFTVENVRIDGDPGGEALYARPECTLDTVRFRDVHVTNVTDAISVWSSTVAPPIHFENITFGTITGQKFNNGPVGIVENGVGTESAAAETPTASAWADGDLVDFTDSGDGTGTGLYRLKHDGTWLGPL